MQAEFSKIQSYRCLFRKLEILCVPHQYIRSLKLFIIDNPNNFQTDLEIHGLHTRSKIQLLVPVANFTSVLKRITYSGIKIHNSIPSNNLNVKNDKKQFKSELYRYLLSNSFYSVREFLEFSWDNMINYFYHNLYCICYY
jgi:hypothetical protein